MNKPHPQVTPITGASMGDDLPAAYSNRFTVHYFTDGMVRLVFGHDCPDGSEVGSCAVVMTRQNADALVQAMCETASRHDGAKAKTDFSGTRQH